ncbi:MAG: hypothetical protein R3350_08745 [Saprospiraceae bacterium]|nr:hypothetical protein [Saprospiraceae bacterium]
MNAFCINELPRSALVVRGNFNFKGSIFEAQVEPARVKARILSGEQEDR